MNHRRREEIVALVNEVFVTDFEIDPDEMAPEKHIFTDLGLDSLDIVDLIVALQKKFGVSMRDQEGIREIRTLDDLYDFILALPPPE